MVEIEHPDLDHIMETRVTTFPLALERELLTAFTETSNNDIRASLLPFVKEGKNRIPAPNPAKISPDTANAAGDFYLPRNQGLLIEQLDPAGEKNTPEWIARSTVIRTASAMDQSTTFNHEGLEAIIATIKEPFTKSLLKALHKRFMCMEIQDLCQHLGTTEKILLRAIENVNALGVMNKLKLKIHVRNDLVVLGPKDPVSTNPLTLVRNRETRSTLFFPKREDQKAEDPATISPQTQIPTERPNPKSTKKPPENLSLKTLEELHRIRNTLSRQYRELQRKITPLPKFYISPTENNNDRNKMLAEIRELQFKILSAGTQNQ